MDKTQQAVAVFNKMAKVYQDKYMDVSLYHDTLDIFCNSITQQNATVLELACGPGNITKYLLSKRPDLNILATDMATNMLALAAANNPGATFQLMDCRNISELNNKYDGIMCGFCLPYLSKQEAIQLLDDAIKQLNPDGVMYISTMEDDYSRSGPQKGSSGDELFMHYHEGDYLIDVLKANKSEIICQQRQVYPGNGDTDLIIIVVKTRIIS